MPCPVFPSIRIRLLWSDLAKSACKRVIFAVLYDLRKTRFRRIVLSAFAVRPESVRPAKEPTRSKRLSVCAFMYPNAVRFCPDGRRRAKIPPSSPPCPALCLCSASAQRFGITTVFRRSSESPPNRSMPNPSACGSAFYNRHELSRSEEHTPLPIRSYRAKTNTDTRGRGSPLQWRGQR